MNVVLIIAVHKRIRRFIKTLYSTRGIRSNCDSLDSNKFLYFVKFEDILQKSIFASIYIHYSPFHCTLYTFFYVSFFFTFLVDDLCETIIMKECEV